MLRTLASTSILAQATWSSALLVGVGLTALAAGAAAGFNGWRLKARSAELASEAKADLAEADAIKNDFVTMVSHEFRTPLASIAGFAQVLGSWRDLPDGEIDEFLGVIGLETKKLGNLVEDVLVIPRLEAGRLKLNPEVFDLSAVVYETSSIVFPSAGGKEVSVSIPGGIPAWGDPKRVEQVIRNLLDNANKYGGDQVLVEGFTLGDHFVIVVSDNGKGVPDDATDLIFEHFEQVSKGDARISQGIGLGLPIARRLARAMGGDVWYERRFPTGSRFCVSITQTEESAMRVVEERERQAANA
ncbi:MAG: HAMP domain-containing histidine kinase [Acidimicrobiia bacterium]|nr:HAMP domain-containing histidine kinase [Acidimicrobiia bacterium]MDH4307080.1 HAMP domain-containing histidine kinase [Acidimicrobiia bacterium]MDH5293066.1 HAMP domain-containing histidine kinase [Acidimicrobiia bacterium]